MKPQFIRNNLPGQRGSIDAQKSEENEVIECVRDIELASSDVLWGSYLFSLMIVLADLEPWEREKVIKTATMFANDGEVVDGTIQ